MRPRDTATGDLFAVPQPIPQRPASMDFRAAIAHLVSDALRTAECDRYGVAATMSRLAGKDVSKAMLDGYSAEAREAFNLPAYLIPAFEAATRTHLITNFLAECAGARMCFGVDALNAEIGRLEREQDERRDLLKQLKAQVRGQR